MYSRQVDGEGRPLAHFAGDFDAAAIALDDAMRDGEPEADSLAARGEKRIEDALQILQRNSRSVVQKLRNHLIVLRPQDDRQPSAIGHRLNGVKNEVEKRLPDLPGIPEDLRNGMLLECDIHLVLLRLTRGELDDLLDQAGRCEPVALGRRRLGEAQKILHHPVEAVHLFEQDAGEFITPIGRIDSLLENLSGTADRAERIADLVSHPGRELAQGREPIGTAQLLFDLENQVGLFAQLRITLLELLGGELVAMRLHALALGQKSGHKADDVVKQDLQILLRPRGGMMPPLKDDMRGIEDRDRDRRGQPAAQQEPEPAEDDGKIIEAAVDVVIRLHLRRGRVVQDSDAQHQAHQHRETDFILPGDGHRISHSSLELKALVSNLSFPLKYENPNNYWTLARAVGYSFTLGSLSMSLFFEILAVVLPVFLVIGLGYFLKRIGLIDSAFLFQTNRLVYYVALPLLLFYKIGTADFFANFNGALVIGASLAIAIGFILSYGYAALRGYPPAARGSFSQGSFRGNLAYIGLAIVLNAYGEDALTRAGILMGFLVPVLNFFAILALLLPHRNAGDQRGAMFWIRQIALNPLILASFAGILWSFLHLPLPQVAERSLKIASGMTLPLALMAIGGAFSLEKLRGDLVRAFLATGIKLAWLPLIAAGLLWMLEVRGLDLAIGVLMSGAPAATATYIMAHQMKGDSELAGSIVMMSTLASAVTYTAALYILRSLGL